VPAGATIVAALALVAALNVGGWRDRLLRRDRPAAATASQQSRRSVAVLGFKNLSGKADHAWLSTALAEMLTTEMAAGGQLRTVAGENVARMKLDLALADADSFGRETLARIRNHSGSDLVIMGSYLALGNAAGGQIRLDFRLQDTRLGETLAAVSETGSESALLDLIARTGSALRQTLGIGQVSPSQASVVRASLPSDPRAAKLYSEGLAKLRAFEAREARDLLEQAVAAEPRHASARAALAAAWAALGYDNKSQDEARQAFTLATDLPREERLSIEGRYREYSHEWSKAIELYRTLWDFFPDTVDYGLRLASAQISAGKAEEALTTLEALRRLPSPAGEDARIDLAESRAGTALGNFKRVVESARRAAVKGQSQGARFVVAQSRADEGWALERLGQTSEATAALAEAERLFADSGNVLGAANAVHTIGNVRLGKGDFVAARKAYNDALAVFRRLGTQKRAAVALNNIGNSFYNQSDLVQAQKYYDEVLRIDREIGDKQGAAGALGNLANVLDAMGDLTGARRMQEECLAAFREVGDKRGIASTLNNLGNVLAELGDVAGARQNYEASLAITSETGYTRGRAFSKFGLADVLAWQDHLEDARAAAEEALALRTALGDESTAALSRMQLGAIAHEQGRTEQAQSLLREAIGVFDKNGSVESSASANAFLARVLVATGGTGAKAAAQRATALAEQSGNRVSRFEATLITARVAAASGNFVEAARHAELVLTEARKYGYVPYQYEARLALGEIEMASGKPDGTARLDALERDAREKGYGLIARKAAGARR
jgi:tetratricopeptide (TPR) repeat protein/TolB-like protein